MIFRSLSRWLRGEDAGISVPPMDGVLKPNNRLEQATRVLTLPSIDNLVAAGSTAYCSGGNNLYSLRAEAGSLRADLAGSFPGAITFLAADSAGRLAVGVADEGIRFASPEGSWNQVALAPDLARCAVAADFTPDGSLLVCIGSREVAAADWKRDLMQHGRSGTILSVDQAGDIVTLVEGLAFPYGIAALGDGRFVYSESWRHCLVRRAIGSPHDISDLLSDLPAYPARLARSAEGGFWLTAFAPRRQLFDIVLREDDYRREMMATIDPSEWVGPDLSGESRPDQPLQAGSVRQMGVIKPWAPSHSYGLVIKCDAEGRPLESWHSRADGTMHGITSVIEFQGIVLATSRGSGTLLNLGTSGAPVESRP